MKCASTASPESAGSPFEEQTVVSQPTVWTCCGYGGANGDLAGQPLEERARARRGIGPERISGSGGGNDVTGAEFTRGRPFVRRARWSSSCGSIRARSSRFRHSAKSACSAIALAAAPSRSVPLPISIACAESDRPCGRLRRYHLSSMTAPTRRWTFRIIRLPTCRRCGLGCRLRVAGRSLADLLVEKAGDGQQRQNHLVEMSWRVHFRKRINGIGNCPERG